MALRAASIEKLPRHVDFPHNSSIALSYSLLLMSYFHTVKTIANECEEFELSADACWGGVGQITEKPIHRPSHPRRKLLEKFNFFILTAHIRLKIAVQKLAL